MRLPLKNLVEDTCPSQPVKYVNINDFLSVINRFGDQLTAGQSGVGLWAAVFEHFRCWTGEAKGGCFHGGDLVHGPRLGTLLLLFMFYWVGLIIVHHYQMGEGRGTAAVVSDG